MLNCFLRIIKNVIKKLFIFPAAAPTLVLYFFAGCNGKLRILGLSIFCFAFDEN